MRVTWCEHIEANESAWKNKIHDCMIYDQWIFCPWCGAKRPEKPKTLSEKLADAGTGFSKGGNSRWDDLAQAAYEHFGNIVMNFDWKDVVGHLSYKDVLLKKLRDSL